MRRRRYLTRVGASLSVGIAGLAGCGAPGEETETETEVEETETEATPVEETETEGAATETGAGQTETEGAAATETGAGQERQIPDEIAMITEGSDFIFNPIGLFVEPGETITWVLESGNHSTTSYTEDNPQANVNRIPNEAESWNSGVLSEQGAEFTYTFEVTGTYDYYCVPHKSLGMVARIVCGEPSGVEGDPPDGPVPSEQSIVDQGVITQEEFNP